MDLRMFDIFLKGSNVLRDRFTIELLHKGLKNPSSIFTYNHDVLIKLWNSILRIFTIDDVKHFEKFILEQHGLHKQYKNIVTIAGSTYRKIHDEYIYRIRIKNNKKYLLSAVFETTQAQLIALETQSAIYYAHNNKISIDFSLFINLVDVSTAKYFTLYFKTNAPLKKSIKVFYKYIMLSCGRITTYMLSIKYFSIIRAYCIRYVDDRYNMADVITKEHTPSNRIRAMAMLPLDLHYNICDDPHYMYYQKHRIRDEFKNSHNFLDDVIVTKFDDDIEENNYNARYVKINKDKPILQKINVNLLQRIDVMQIVNILGMRDIDHHDEYADPREEFHYHVQDSFRSQNTLFTIHRIPLYVYYDLRQNTLVQKLLWCIAHITKLSRKSELFKKIWLEIVHPYND